MYNMLEIETWGRERQHQILAEVEQYRLINLVSGGRSSLRYSVATALLNVGQMLVRWGTRWQAEDNFPLHHDRQYTV